MENSKLLTILVEVDEGTKTPYKAHNEILSLFGVVKSLPNKYCSQCGEPIAKSHKFWCIDNT